MSQTSVQNDARSLVPPEASTLTALSEVLHDDHVRHAIDEKIHGIAHHLSLGELLHLSSDGLASSVRRDFVSTAAAEYEREMAECSESFDRLPEELRSAISTASFTGECHEWRGRHDLGHLFTTHLHFTGLKAALLGVAAIAQRSPDRVAVNASIDVSGQHYVVYISSQGTHGEKMMYLGIRDRQQWIFETKVPCPLQVAERLIATYEPTAETIASSLTTHPVRRLASWLCDEVKYLLAG